MDIRQLQYFLELSRQEHISSTADILNISQPALSKSISNLEKELGVKLFDHYGNRIRLNSNGKEFAQYAARCLGELEHGLKAMRRSKYQFRGAIRITCHAFADGIVPCINEYLALNPEVQINLFQTPTGDDQLYEKSDFILSGVNSEEQGWIRMPLYREEGYIVISPRYREYPPEVTSLDLKDLEDDMFATEVAADRDFIDGTMVGRFCRAAGFEPKIRCRTDDFITKIRIIDHGQAITILPYSCLGIARKLSPDLQFFSVRNMDTCRTVSLLCRKESQLTEVAQDFLEFVRDYYEGIIQ